ncbi:MAG: oligoendopeptidase F, partial [Alphaproteobacteria bacterium]|nr:oligoendopeptidase F [Alphaproteobacteria bacterium]
MALAAEHDETTTLGTLPEWRLTDMYDGPDSAALTGDLVEATQASAAFATAYAGKIGGLQGADLGAAVAEYERIDEILSRVSSYAQLVHSGDMSDPEVGRFYQSVVER